MGLKEGFEDYWGWKLTIHELTDGDPFKQEYWYAQNWIMFLNELAFRKEKNYVESELRRTNS